MLHEVFLECRRRVWSLGWANQGTFGLCVRSVIEPVWWQASSPRLRSVLFGVEGVWAFLSRVGSFTVSFSMIQVGMHISRSHFPTTPEPNQALEARRLLVTESAFSSLREGTFRAKQPYASAWALAIKNMTTRERAKVNSYIDRSFRDIADDDYIAARALYRLGLSQQFLWASLQAIEKYLKAILLYNDVSTKGLGHDIASAYDRVIQIPDIEFDIPQGSEKFIRYLSAQGPNRYFERPFHTFGEELFDLDSSVWHLRRYCRFLRMEPLILKSGTSVDQFALALDQIKRSKERPNKFKIFGGRLEKVIARKSRAREHLVWKNFFYGTYKKKIIKNFTYTSASAIPANFIFPEVFHILESRIQFSADVKKLFKP